MSLQNHLDRLKQLLSDEDRVLFEQLNQRIKQLNGDFSSLTQQERDFVAQMEQKYGDQIRAMAVEHVEEVVADEPEERQKVIKDEFPLLKTEFAEYVKDMLLRELQEEHRDLKSAVSYAYETKWLPQELRNPDVCETLFERFFSDIEKANQWRYEFQGQKTDTSNKTMAVGLTWFMYVYQLKQWVDKYQ